MPVWKRTVDRVCDLCGSGDRVSRYRIEYTENPVARRTADLCWEHRQPLEEILRRVPIKGGRHGGLKERQVVSPAAVRRARAKARKAQTQKKTPGK